MYSIVATTAVVCGQLPEAVASALQPLLVSYDATATVTSLPRHPAAPTPILLTLAPSQNSSHVLGRVALDALMRAAQAVHDKISESAGERLRRHYADILGMVALHDSHLLDEADKLVITALHSLDVQAQALLLRLRFRKGPWFRVAALAYADVDDVDAAISALKAAGLLRCLELSGARN